MNSPAYHSMNARFSLLLLILMVVGVASCQPSATKPQQDVPAADQTSLACPASADGEHILHYTGFVSSYNHATLVPNWVAYELTAYEVDGTYSATSNFSRDPNLKGSQASREDYSCSGWDKGHMVPKADLKWSEQAWWESHYFTNICPQNHQLNGGPWNSLERQVRRWAKLYGCIYVVVGPIFTDCAYGTIGAAEVQIPDAFFKALLAPDGDGYKAIAFVMANNDLPHSIRQCAMSVDQLEELLGRDLFPALDDTVESVVEATISLQAWGL